MSTKAKTKQTITSERQEPTYYAMIPKMAILDLNPFELALYCNYKQTTGEYGQCTKSNATLAQECHMSVNRMKAARASLVKHGYIRVVVHEDDKGFQSTPATVIVRDVWEVNHQLFAEQKAFGGVSPGDTPGYQDLTPPYQEVTGGVSPGDTKEEPNKKIEIKDYAAPKKGAGTRAKPKPTSATSVSHVRNPLFDAVAEFVFGISDAEQLKVMDAEDQAGARIGMIAAWLGCKSDRFRRGGNRKPTIVGFIAREAQPDHVRLFVSDYRRDFPNADPPRDIEKFVEHWRAWASKRNGHSGIEARALFSREQLKAKALADEQEAARLARQAVRA